MKKPFGKLADARVPTREVRADAPGSDPRSDSQLVILARQGDREAYRVLVERYQTRAFGIAYDILKNREDAEDVAQESFVKAFLSLSKFKGEASFYTWLYRIVYNMAIDYRRKIVRHGGSTTEYDEAKHVQQSVGNAAGYNQQGPYDEIFRKEQASTINRALSEISEEHRAVIVFREVDGMNYDQIAKVVGISKGTVMSRLHYARKKLQKALRDIAPEGLTNTALTNTAVTNSTAPDAAAARSEKDARGDEFPFRLAVSGAREAK